MTNHLDRFWSKVRKTDSCWFWMASKNDRGYGKMMWLGKIRYAHRISYEMHHGQIPEGMTVDHICHNRLCVNPSHLRVCTIAENVRNSLVRSDNTSGFKGVHFDSATGRWAAQISFDGVMRSLGRFKTAKEAHEVYLSEAKKLFGTYANSGEDRAEES